MALLWSWSGVGPVLVLTGFLVLLAVVTRLLGRWQDREQRQWAEAPAEEQAGLRHARHTLGLLIGLTLSLSLVLTAFEWRSDEAMLLVSGIDSGMVPACATPPPLPKPTDWDTVTGACIPLLSYDQMHRISKPIPADRAAMPAVGLDQFYADLYARMRYPTPARQAGITGKVWVQFVVQPDGRISDMEIVQGISQGCDEEVLRLLGQTAAWTPALEKGQPTAQGVLLPVIFPPIR